MPETTVDVKKLYAALDQKRKVGDLSWRELARALKISPSTFTRMAQGLKPDVDTFATLLRWLAMPAEHFLRPSKGKKYETEPVAVICSYLRSAPNISERDAAALEDIIQVAYKHLAGQQ